MTNIKFRFRKGAGSNIDIIFGTVTMKPTLAHSRGTSMVLPAPSIWDIVDGEVLATNVQPTPEPVNGVLEWGYEVTVKDRHSKSYSFLVGVPDSTTDVEFVSLPRYFETKPPLFGQGPRGEQGEASTVSVGTVSGGTTAQVTNSGTNSDAVLNFVLPKGDKGDRGDGVPSGGSALQIIRKNSGNTATEWATPDKGLVGLGNVDNTSDANKPVSTAQKTYIDQSNTLAYRARTATSLPSEYPEGVTVMNVNSANGWPNISGSLNQVKTERARDNNATLQTITPLTATDATSGAGNSILYRKSAPDNSWGAWQQFATIQNLKSALVVNVKDFGAVGDGVTDDSQAFRDAALYVRGSFGQGGTIVARPGGNFNLGSQVRVYSNTVVDLEYSRVTRTAGSGYVAFCAVAGAAIKGYGTGGQNITFTRVKFKGDFASGRTLNNVFHHVDNLNFLDCTFDEAVVSGHAIDLAGCSNVTISNCIFRGRYEVEGRAYVEAVQIDHSTRSGAGGELVEDAGAWDGLPCKNITMTDCASEPLTIGATTYLAPRLIGSHSRVADVRHKNINISNVTITDSGSTATDANYRGWIHFTHSEDITITGYTAINTRNDNAIALGFGSVATTYPLSTVNSSSPVINSDAGPVACRNIRAQVQVIGNNQTVQHDAIILSGQTGAPTEDVVLDVQAKNLHSGDILEVDQGGTVVNVSHGWNVTANIQATKVRRLINVENSRYITANLQGRSVASTGMRVDTANTVQMSGAQLTDCATLGFFSGVTNLTLSGNTGISNGSSTRPYDAMVSVREGTNVNATGNNLVNSGSSLIYGMNFYGTTIASAANGTMGTGFTTTVRVQAGSTVAVANTVAN